MKTGRYQGHKKVWKKLIQRNSVRQFILIFVQWVSWEWRQTLKTAVKTWWSVMVLDAPTCERLQALETSLLRMISSEMKNAISFFHDKLWKAKTSIIILLSDMKIDRHHKNTMPPHGLHSNKESCALRRPRGNHYSFPTYTMWWHPILSKRAVAKNNCPAVGKTLDHHLPTSPQTSCILAQRCQKRQCCSVSLSNDSDEQPESWKKLVHRIENRCLILEPFWTMAVKSLPSERKNVEDESFHPSHDTKHLWKTCPAETKTTKQILCFIFRTKR